MSSTSTIVSVEGLARIVEAHHSNGKRGVPCRGAFDLLHIRHTPGPVPGPPSSGGPQLCMMPDRRTRNTLYFQQTHAPVCPESAATGVWAKVRPSEPHRE